MTWDGTDRRDPDLTRRIAVDAAKQAIAEAVPMSIRATFLQMGLDPENPLEVQQDMQFLRKTRTRCESAGTKALFTVLGLGVAGAASFIWDAVVSKLHIGQ